MRVLVIFLLAVTKYHIVKKYCRWLVIMGLTVQKAEGVKHQWQEHTAAVFQMIFSKKWRAPTWVELDNKYRSLYLFQPQ